MIPIGFDITPIQTLGSVEFDSFDKNEDGTIAEIMTEDGKPLPVMTWFHYITADASYTPVNCEQPLCYLLSFMSKKYRKAEAQQEDTGFWGKLKNILRLIPNMDAFQVEMGRMSMKRIENNQGYKVLFGRGRI